MGKPREKRLFLIVLIVVIIIAISVLICEIIISSGVLNSSQKEEIIIATPTNSPVTEVSPTPLATPNGPPTGTQFESPAVDAKMLIGKWDSESGVYISIRADNRISIGVTGNESEAVTYSFLISGNRLKINFLEGELVDSTFSLFLKNGLQDTLTLNFANSTLVLKRR
ncbi:MAG: hypothetical protein WCQ41_03425 [Bacillota bacterium]